ncbi:MAG: pyridoxal-dependent decarboxylase [Balneolaceae bacterium]|nr:pyridoxal-dependent decarboxylase [Balneolaceae bacterium]
MNLLDRLEQLEKQSRKLEINSEERHQLTEKAVRYAESFLEEVDDHPAFEKTEDKGRPLLDEPFAEEPESLDKLLDLFDEQVNHTGLNPTSGAHMGYIPGGGLYPSALADFLAAVTNRYAGMFFSSPGAVRMENMCIRWLAEPVGYPDSAAGNLTSGGSIANLVALVTGTRQCGPALC